MMDGGMMGGMGSMMSWMMGIGLLGWVLVIALLATIVVILLQALTRRRSPELRQEERLHHGQPRQPS